MAGPIELTDEERACIAQAKATDPGFGAALSSYAPYLGPVALFGAYGIAIGDVTAVALAFACLLGLNLWWIKGQTRITGAFRSICRKVDEAQAAVPPRAPD
jgi:hypothetical protein